jgi:hypothetical protein
LPELAGNVEYGENRIPLFLFVFKLKSTKIFVCEYFNVFKGAFLFYPYENKILTVHRK